MCVTPESSTKRRMSLGRRGAAGALQALGAGAQQGAAGALQALGADDGPGGGAGRALMVLCAGTLAARGFALAANLVVIGYVITYVL